MMKADDMERRKAVWQSPTLDSVEMGGTANGPVPMQGDAFTGARNDGAS